MLPPSAQAASSQLDEQASPGYTPGMKTAVSIPDETFQAAERLAARLRKSRSQLYAEALAEYVARRDPEAVTEAWNAVADELGEEPDAFIAEAARRVLERSEW
jgi:predicted transcriptional regulator